jgi:hypothetical protein
VDVFAVALEKGQTLVATVEANHTLRAPIDAVLQVTSADGTVSDQNHDHRGLDPQLVHTAAKDGIHLVRLFAFPSQPDSSIRHFGSDASLYRLTLTTGGVIDFATPLAVERGKDASLTLHGWNLREASLRLSAAEGRIHPIWSATGGVVVREPHPCFDLTGEPAGPLAPPVTVTGRVSKPGGASRVTVTGVKGRPLAVRIEAPTVGSPLAPVLRVYDAGKKQVAMSEAGLNADLETTFTPPADGEFTFEVRDQYADGGVRSFYRLRVTPVVPRIDPTASTDRLTLAPGKPLDVPITLNPKNGFATELDWTVSGLPEGVTVKPASNLDPKSVTLRFEMRQSVAVQTPIRITAAAKKDPKDVREVTAKIDGLDATTSDLWLTVAPPTPVK